jgi:C4-dicarboxylate transporter DctQ subunit
MTDSTAVVLGPGEGARRAVRVATRLCRLAGMLATTLFVGAALVICYEAVMRYAARPTDWAQDLAMYFMIAGAFLSQASVMLEDSHVRVDVFLQMMSAHAQRFWIRATLALTLAYVCVAAWQTLLQAANSYDIGRMSTSLFRIPTWIPEATMPIGFALLAVAIVIRIAIPYRKDVAEEVDESLQQL